MASDKQLATIGTTAENVVLTGAGDFIHVKSIDGAGYVAVRIDGIAAVAAADTEGFYTLAAAAGDELVIKKNVKGSVTLSMDASVATLVAAWLDDA